jgi:hypothetical protein
LSFSYWQFCYYYEKYPCVAPEEKSAYIFIKKIQIPEEFRYSKSVYVKRAKQISHLNSPRISGAIEDRKFVNGEWGG